MKKTIALLAVVALFGGAYITNAISTESTTNTYKKVEEQKKMVAMPVKIDGTTGCKMMEPKPIPGVVVGIRNVDNNIHADAMTNEKGVFSMTGLSEGVYSIYYGTNFTGTPMEKIKTVNGTVSGRITIQACGDEPKPVPPPIKDCILMMDTAKMPESVDGKMVRPCVRPFEKDKWDADRIGKLKEVLIKESVSDSTTEKAASVSDFKEEVMRLQKKFGIPQTGYVGDMTTKKLNDLISTYDVKTMKGN